MNAPIKSIFDLQQAALQAMTVAFAQVFEFWARMFEMQMGHPGAPTRERRSHAEIAHGATLTDHYGKREHDIDPEHDV
ncbi:MAG: hypothetical protein IPJ62_10050 [Betaproteobacteria bacterium]|nr:hypothetical protein [Betaproteobacteria bacterium]